MVLYFLLMVLDVSFFYIGVYGKVSCFENLFINENRKVFILFFLFISYILLLYIQLIDILLFNEFIIKKNSIWFKIIFLILNKGILYLSVNIVDELLDFYMEISFNFDFLIYLLINMRIYWLLGIVNSIYNGINRNLELLVEVYFLNDENIIVSFNYVIFYLDDLNLLSKVVLKQFMISFYYL